MNTKRQRYVVTLARTDGTRSQHHVWAESPEHAIKKAQARADQPEAAGTAVEIAA